MDRTHHIFIWFSIKYSLQFLSPSPQRKTENKQKIPPRLFPPVTDYYPYSVQLNQKEIKERVNCHMSVFQIPQILEILTLFKNSEINILLPINKKVRCVETSHPSSAGDPGLSREQSPSCRHVRSTDWVGRARHSVFCSEGNKTGEVWPVSSKVRIVHHDSVAWFLMCPRAGLRSAKREAVLER